MKGAIISMPAGATITAKFWLKQSTGAAVENDTAGSEIGVAISGANTTTRPNVGCMKQGLIKLPAVAATYNIGDKLEVATGGQNLQAFSKGVTVATAAESKILSGTADLLVYVNVA